MLTKELEHTQFRYMLAQQEKEMARTRKAAQMNKGDVNGTLNAKEALLTFTVDAERDVLEMKREL